MMEKNFIAAPNWKEQENNDVIDIDLVRNFVLHKNEGSIMPMITFSYYNSEGEASFWWFKTMEEAEYCYKQLVESFATVIPSKQDLEKQEMAFGKELPL